MLYTHLVCGMPLLLSSAYTTKMSPMRSSYCRRYPCYLSTLVPLGNLTLTIAKPKRPNATSGMNKVGNVHAETCTY